LEQLDPWWFSVLAPVNEDYSTTLTALLGFEHTAGLNFLVSTGLIGSSGGDYCVVQKEWEKFIIEENLHDFMWPLNRSSVLRSKYYFLHYGRKEKLHHRPRDQWPLDKSPMEPRPILIIDKQQKFHRQLSQALKEIRISYNVNAKRQQEEEEDSTSSESVAEGEDEKPSASTIVQDSYINVGDDTPCLAALLGVSQVPKSALNSLFLELMKVMKTDTNGIDFEYRNAVRGFAVIVPKVKTYDSFNRQAKRSKWIKGLVEHIAGDASVDDAAQWLLTYLGKHYEASFTLASEALGLPIVQRMDASSAEAMWSDANINVVQQRIIRRHLRHHFGKRLFISENSFKEDRKHYSVNTHYNCLKYYKGGDTSLKPEKCPYWFRDPAEVVAIELTKLLDYSDTTCKANKLGSICNFTCSVVAGADQGQGSWRSWVKVSIESGQKIRERMATELDYDPKSSYIVSQVAHITCKKDHHEILSATVSDALSVGYEKLQSSCLVFIQPPNKKIKAVYVSKHAVDLKLEQATEDASKCLLTYFLSSNAENGFSMKHIHTETFEGNSTILLTIPTFSIYITGDLAFYGDVLGMPNSSSYWCPWCLLSRPQWQTPPSDETPPEERTAKFLQDTYDAILKDEQKRLKPVDKKGVSCAMHYKSLTPQDFAPPLLHMEIGMVNHAWDNFEQWIDDDVEMIPQHEKDSRKAVITTAENLERAISQRTNDENTVNVDIRVKSAEVKVLKSNLRKESNPAEFQRLQLTILALEAEVANLKNQQKLNKENVKTCQAAHADAKKKVADYKAERGKPEASIIAEIEMYMETLRISRAAYHGGDFNGVCCRRIVGNCKAIAENIETILKAKKDDRCDNAEIQKKMHDFQQLLGLLDAAFAYLNIYYPNELEKQQAREAVTALMQYWRKLGLVITLKAHVMETHVSNFNDKHGVGDKEESFIEQGHQVGAKENSRYARLTNFEKKSTSIINARLQASHPLVTKQKLEVLQASKRKKRDSSSQASIAKEEKKTKRDEYIKKSKME